ncbi:MAG: NAD(P)H-binding protein [Solirubrobacteraceae bacterium]
MERTLVTGASGYVGSRLVDALRRLDQPVGCVVRDPRRVGFDASVTVHEADVLDPRSLEAIGDGYSTAFYLVHSMGRGGDAHYAQRDAMAAVNFARFARASGIERVVYLGGLGDHPGSRHLRSRQHVGEILRDEGPPLTWFKAGMVVGSGSESYRTLRSLVERLPVMIAPAWLSTPTQAIAIGDLLLYLTQTLHKPETSSRVIQIGSPELLTYGEMLDQMAVVLGERPRPRIPVPLLTPWLSSHWIGLVTPVDVGVARPLIEGLSTETIVTDPSGMALFDIEPRSFDQALREALAEEPRAAGRRSQPIYPIRKPSQG